MSKKRKNHVTLPRSYDPGPGYPRETLAYLSDAEHELIRQLTDGKWNRGPKGVRSYADDSASSKGVSRGDKSGTKGNGGLGQGGQGGGRSPGGGGSRGPGGPSGPNSGPSRSSSSGSSGGGNKSSPAGAGRDSSRGLGQGAGGQAIGRGGVSSTAGGKAADVARVNAARSVGVSNPVSFSGAMDRGFYHSFTNNLPGMSNPTQFDKTIRPTNMVTATHVPMDTWSKQYNANSLSPGAQKIHQAIVDNAFRTNTPVDFFSGRSPRSSGTLQHPLGQAIDVRLKDPVTGSFVGAPQIGALAANPIGNIKPLMGRSTRVAEKIQGALEKPYREFATGVLNSFMDNPGVYGEFNNQRWGGSFGGAWGKDYMHYDEGKITSAVNADQAALRREAANYKGPGSLSGGTMLAGGQPTGSPLSGGTQVAGIANVGLNEAARIARASNALKALSAPTPTLPNDPRMSVPQGAFPARAQSTVAGDPRLSQTPLGGFPAAHPPSQVSTDPRVAQTPVGAFPAASRPASVFAGDPRVSTTPLGSLPAAKPKEIKLAWDVPPIGGSLPSWKADALGVWSTNRPPSGPAAQPGTIHSQTAQATSAPATTDSAPSVWESGANWIKAKTDEVQTQIDAAKETPAFKFAQKHPRIAEFALKMMMGGGGAGAGQNFGNPQDRSGFGNRPQYMQPQSQQMAQTPQSDVSTDPLTVLNDLKANMIAKGASPEQIAYVQSIIDELSNSQVA